MKKTLAILLTLALVICMMPANAFAAEPSTGPATLTDQMITLSVTSEEYNGNNGFPKVTVSGGAVEGTDYTVTWSPNQSASKLNAGSYTVTVTPQNGSKVITGSAVTATTKFEIKKYNLNSHYVAAYVDDQLSTATADTVKNAIEYLADGNNNTTFLQNALTPQVDLTNKKVTFTLKDTTNFEGTVSAATYKVVKDIASCDVTVTATEYKGRALTQQELNALVTVRTGGTNSASLSSNNYTVSCADVLTANNGNPTTVTIKGQNEYGGSKTVSAKVIKQRDARNVTIQSIDSQVSGVQASNIEPQITDYLNGKTVPLTKGKDYDVTKVVENGNVGVATIVFKGNYVGSVEKNFTISSGNYVITQGDASIVGAGTGNVKSTYYNGTTQSVSVNVSKTGATYRVEYRNSTGVAASPKDAGDYRVYVIGTGNYAGTVLAGTLKIKPIPLDWTEIVLGSATVYDSVSRTYVPKVTLRTKAYTYGYNGYTGYVTIPETDYNVSYRWVNSTSAYLRPTAVVTVASNAVNLTNAVDSKVTEITQEFSNATKNIAYCTASFTDGRSSSAYTGRAVTPRITVRDGYTTLDSSAYTISYKDASGKTVARMRDAGTYTIVIKGNGVYYGELTLTYTIIGTDISNYTVTLRESSVKADGFAKIPVITSVAYSYYSKLSVNDYTVSYQDSTGKTVTRMSAPGTYKVIVTGKNGYSGSCYATFRIVGLAQSVTGVKNAYKAYPTTETFKLYPQVTEGTITYTSSDPSVASVDAFGYVTPLRAGRAVITISTIGNVKYDPADKDVVIKVYPNKAKLSQKPWNTGKKGQIKVRWNKQDNVTRYQVIYSRDKSFKKGSYKVRSVNAATNSYTTQSTTVKGLYSGYTYYVKVRAIKYVYNGYGQRQVYYGNWSNWRSVKVK